MPVNDSLFQQSQVLIDAQAATFQNLLHNNDISDFLGTFTCEVSNARGAVQESVELNGKRCCLFDQSLSINFDPLTVDSNSLCPWVMGHRIHQLAKGKYYNDI